MARIRVVHIPTTGEVFRPTTTDLHSGINNALSRSQLTLSIDTHEVRHLAATSPHSSGQHEVLWLNKKSDDAPISWDETAEKEILAHPEFWQELEKIIREKQHAISPHTRAYMYLGFTLPEWLKNGQHKQQKNQEQPTSQTDKAPVIGQGLQSQARLHMHLVNALLPTEVHDWLDSEQSAHLPHIARFFNLAGEAMLRLTPEELSDFGEPFTYQQDIVGNSDLVYPRTFFAFPSLEEAIQKSVALKQAISDRWLLLAQLLVENSPFPVAGQLLAAQQSAVPNFAFIIPSEQDQRQTQRTASETWVVPFSVVGVPELLTPGGVVLRRGTR